MLLTSGLIQGSFSGMEPRPRRPLNPTCFGEGPAGHSGHEQGVAPCPVSPQVGNVPPAATGTRIQPLPTCNGLGFTIPHPQNRC